jgi:hypothetical protein
MECLILVAMAVKVSNKLKYVLIRGMLSYCPPRNIAAFDKQAHLWHFYSSFATQPFSSATTTQGLRYQR